MDLRLKGAMMTSTPSNTPAYRSLCTEFEPQEMVVALLVTGRGQLKLKPALWSDVGVNGWLML
jgi:hypothetical protein